MTMETKKLKNLLIIYLMTEIILKTTIYACK